MSSKNPKLIKKDMGPFKDQQDQNAALKSMDDQMNEMD